MSNLELQKKAENFIKEKKWNLHLLELFLNTQSFSSLLEHNNFEEEFNFGFTDIFFLDKEIELKHSKKTITFLRAKFNDINFTIGGDLDSFISFDDSVRATLTIILYIDEKLIMNITYDSQLETYGTISYPYKFSSVEEFHNHASIHELLLKTYLAHKQKLIQRQNKYNSERDNNYKDKFSFD